MYEIMLPWVDPGFLFCFVFCFVFWLRWVFVAARGLSLVAVSVIAVRGLLIAVASLVAEHRL